jgi:hypothetical protein
MQARAVMANSIVIKIASGAFIVRRAYADASFLTQRRKEAKPQRALSEKSALPLNCKCGIVSPAMSEFKYACPVCGQHIKCDVSQAGSVMECPTCFQKITVPQAPASGEQKFILTGTQVSDRSFPLLPPSGPAPGAGAKKSTLTIIVAGLLGTMAIAFFTLKGKLPLAFLNSTSASTNQQISRTPSANDTNWMLVLDTNLISDSSVVGRIHGQDFLCERATLQNGILTLRAEEHGPLGFGVSINFNNARAEALSGQSINITSNTGTAARVTLHWKSDGQAGRESFNSGYALRLEFATLTNNHLPGKIHLCAPDDEKSYIVGTFNAEAFKSKPKPKK